MTSTGTEGRDKSHQGSDELALLQARVGELETLLADAQGRARRERDTLVRSLSHALRNPLSPITTSLAVLRPTATPEALRVLDVIERQVQEMTRLIEGLTLPPAGTDA